LAFELIFNIAYRVVLTQGPLPVLFPAEYRIVPIETAKQITETSRHPASD